MTFRYLTLFIIIFVMLGSSVATAQPDVCAFCGSVTFGETPFKDGSQIMAYVDNEEVASTTVEDGKYCMKIACDDCSGKTVIFETEIGGEPVSAGTASWTPGDVKLVNLNAADSTVDADTCIFYGHVTIDDVSVEPKTVVIARIDKEEFSTFTDIDSSGNAIYKLQVSGNHLNKHIVLSVVSSNKEIAVTSSKWINGALINQNLDTSTKDVEVTVTIPQEESSAEQIFSVTIDVNSNGRGISSASFVLQVDSGIKILEINAGDLLGPDQVLSIPFDLIDKTDSRETTAACSITRKGLTHVPTPTGTLAIVKMMTAENLATGEYSIRLTKLKLTDERSEVISPVTRADSAISVDGGIPGDLNHDGSINLLDFTILASNYGTVCDNIGFISSTDINSDCSINAADLVIMTGNWGK